MAAWKTPIIRIALIVLAVILVTQIINLQSQMAEKREQLAVLDQRVEQYQQENAALREDMQDGASDEDIREIARTELGYAEPGERVFVDTSSR